MGVEQAWRLSRAAEGMEVPQLITLVLISVNSCLCGYIFVIHRATDVKLMSGSFRGQLSF